MTISVIMPVYNVEKYIYKSIKSLTNQSFKDFELILVNDETKDRSIDIALDILINSDINYKIINQPNSGVSVARNNGINNSSGEYIYFLDSDDYVEDDFFEKINKKLKETDADIIYCDYRHVDEDGKILIESSTNVIEQVTSGKEMALKLLKDEFSIWVGSGIYKSEIIKKNNLRFDNNRKYAEDITFISKALLYSDKIVGINEKLAYYLRREGAVTKSVSEKHLDCYYSFKDLLEFVEKNFNEEKEIIKTLKEYKIPYSICHIFSMFMRDENYKDKLLKFLSKDEIKTSLNEYKMLSFNKKYLRYYIQCKLIRIYQSTRLLYTRRYNWGGYNVRVKKQ